MWKSNKKEGSCLISLSGGADSTICLFLAKEKYKEVHTVAFDYGQRHQIELTSAAKVSALAGAVSHEVISLPNCLKGKSFLTDSSLEIENFTSFNAMEHHNAFKENKLDSSFVPMRNTLFLTIAANRAYVKGCTSLITGVTAADFAEYGPFSWAWLGGFIDAEGCINRINGNGYRLSISQKDPELFYRLGKWITSQFPDFTYGLSGRDGCFDMTIGSKAYTLIHGELSPHLHSSHRRGQAVKYGAPLFKEVELNDAYVAGFWEGDGCCYSSFSIVGKKKQYQTANFNFQFFQKDPEVLEKIQTYLASGHLNQRNTQNKIWYLIVTDGPVRAKLLTRLRKHFCVLGSFRKITKYRHKINMEAGGFNPPYPDCSPDFIFSFQKALNESLLMPDAPQLAIETPLMFLTKAESVLLARQLPGCWEALAYTTTSYDGKYPPVGMNHANVLRAHGFEVAGLPDPLVLRAHSEGLMHLPLTQNYDLFREAS